MSSEVHEYACGCIIEFDDSGKGKKINTCEKCKTGVGVKIEPKYNYLNYEKPKWKK